MLNNLSQTIKKIRLKRGFSQGQVARELEIARPTYAQIEEGKRDLTITEARRMAALFGVDFNSFLEGKEVSPIVEFEKEKSKKKNKEPEIRISVPQKNLKKFKEVLLYVLAKVGGKPNVGESVLNKLFYFIDFDYYEKYEEQLIGATYIKNHFGPTPCEFKKIVEEMKKRGEIEEVKSQHFKFRQKKYLPLRNPDLGVLSAREVSHIDEVLARLSNKNAKEICDYSHGDVPYQVHEEGEKISYESVFYRDDKYSVRIYQDEL